MICITDTITLKSVTPQQCWQFLASMHEGDNYLKWHPTEHVWLKLLRGDGQQVGSKFRFKEQIGGKPLILSYMVIAAKKDRFIEYGFAFPLSLLSLGKQCFTMTANGDDTEFTSELCLGYNAPLTRQLGDWLIRRLFPIDAISKHIHEEGYYLTKELTS